VRVHVDDGTVTLTGTVRRPHERLHAEAIIRQVDGVRAVVNNITVAQIVSAEGPDGSNRGRDRR
jgi:osmotically-inducible protein OsmY